MDFRTCLLVRRDYQGTWLEVAVPTIEAKLKQRILSQLAQMEVSEL
jgi:hypothetical protein